VSSKKLSRVIKTLRQEKGLSQQALADQVGVTGA
jgi:transcriptional regulator with XRE-family HTH domain